MEKAKQNGLLNWASGECVTTPRIEDAIAGSYKSAFWTVVAQIQSRIKTRRRAANLVILVKISRWQKLSELKNFFPEMIEVKGSFFLAVTAVG